MFFSQIDKKIRSLRHLIPKLENSDMTKSKCCPKISSFNLGFVKRNMNKKSNQTKRRLFVFSLPYETCTIHKTISNSGIVNVFLKTKETPNELKSKRSDKNDKQETYPPVTSSRLKIQLFYY